MVQLIPMQQEDFEPYRKEHEQLLPDSLQSKYQNLFSIFDDTSGQKLGVLRVNITNNQAFIYDFRIDEGERGKGYGKHSLMALDEKLKSMNVESVGLHVFGDNATAQALYKKLGHRIIGIQMKKDLK